MLWYKSWLETRYRLLFNLILVMVVLTLQHSSIQTFAPHADPQAVVNSLKIFLSLWTLTTFIMMAGTGIATQTLLATKGLHGSMHYTLTLPVSRLRMVLVRAGMGWVEAAGFVGLLCWVMWLMYPMIRAVGTPLEMVEYAGTLIACGSTIYFLSVLLGSFMNDQARAMGSVFSIFFLWWVSVLGKLPVSIDVFRAMRRGAPFLHTVQWTPIGFSIAVSAVLFFATLQIVRLREY